MSKYTSSRLSPLRHPFGEAIGSGKDNRVYELREPGLPDRSTRPEAERALPRKAGELLVKVSHPARRGEPMTAEEALNDARYKQAKYDMLKLFLGNAVPQSMFLVGNKTSGGGKVLNKSYTLQERVPQVMLSDLTPEQRNSDVLRGEMYRLVSRLQVMHQVMDRARDIVEGQGGEFLVEDSLDLGPLSKYVRAHQDDNAETFNYKHMINGFKASPNLLVDPETMWLSCVDFGQGQWSDQYGLQIGIVRDIVEHDPVVREKLGMPAINGAVPATVAPA